MENHDSLDLFPRKRIKPYDGMAVTADVWEQAHAEHLSSSQAHNVFSHGAGILSGLEVSANHPPDRFVFISPGAAVDQAGKVIVLTKTVCYDLGEYSSGTFHLMLAYGSHEEGGTDSKRKLIHYDFEIAARPELPNRPAVEIARITLRGRGRPIRNAIQPEHPRNEEIDLRFRNLIVPASRRFVHVGLIHLGDYVTEVIKGWEFLAHACQQLSFFTLAIDTGLTLLNNPAAYNFISISGCGSFTLNASEIKSLRKYLETRTMLYCEALDDAADYSFDKIFQDLGRTISPLAKEDALLTTPFLFNTPPLGSSNGQVSRDREILYSCAGYSLAWMGKLLPGHNSRADIRSAHEWGVNTISYFLRMTAEQRRDNGPVEQLSIGG